MRGRRDAGPRASWNGDQTAIGLRVPGNSDVLRDERGPRERVTGPTESTCDGGSCALGLANPAETSGAASVFRQNLPLETP